MTDISSQTLEKQITAFLEEAAKTAPPGALDTVGAEIAKMVQSAAGANFVTKALQRLRFRSQTPGAAPRSFQRFSSADPLSLVFYRGGWCPFCDLQLRAYQESLGAITTMGATLIAISPQTPGPLAFRH